MDCQIYDTWAANKPLFLSAFSVDAIETVQSLSEFMEARRLRQGPFIYEPATNLKEWLELYSSPKKFQRELATCLCGDLGQPICEMMDALRNPKQSTDIGNLMAFGAIVTCFSATEEILEKGSFSQLLEVGKRAELEQTDEEIQELCSHPAMQFALRVAVPCVFVYGVSTTKLLKQVRGGGVDAEKAVERLVRLDQRVAQHRTVRRWVEGDKRVSSFRANKIRKWMHHRTAFDKPKSNSHWLKVVLGTLSMISDLFDAHQEVPALRELADAAGDSLPAELREYLLNKPDCDLSREIRRKRPHFDLPHKPDRSSYEAVRALMKEIS